MIILKKKVIYLYLKDKSDLEVQAKSHENQFKRMSYTYDTKKSLMFNWVTATIQLHCAVYNL